MRTKIVEATAEQLTKDMRATSYVDPAPKKPRKAKTPTLADLGLVGHPGIMKSGPNRGQMAESPTAKAEHTTLFVGKRIKAVRCLTREELAREGWSLQHGSVLATAVELEDGTVLYAAADNEGNRAGALFCTLPDGTSIYVQEEK